MQIAYELFKKELNVLLNTITNTLIGKILKKLLHFLNIFYLFKAFLRKNNKNEN